MEAKFNQRAHYYCDLERKYSGAEQLIVKRPKECETVRREADGNPPSSNRFNLKDRFGIEPEIIAKLARTGARIYKLGISYNGRTYREGKRINWKEGLRALIHSEI